MQVRRDPAALFRPARAPVRRLFNQSRSTDAPDYVAPWRGNDMRIRCPRFGNHPKISGTLGRVRRRHDRCPGCCTFPLRLLRLLRRGASAHCGSRSSCSRACVDFPICRQRCLRLVLCFDRSCDRGRCRLLRQCRGCACCGCVRLARRPSAHSRRHRHRLVRSRPLLRQGLWRAGATRILFSADGASWNMANFSSSFALRLPRSAAVRYPASGTNGWREVAVLCHLRRSLIEFIRGAHVHTEPQQQRRRHGPRRRDPNPASASPRICGLCCGRSREDHGMRHRRVPNSFLRISRIARRGKRFIRSLYQRQNLLATRARGHVLLASIHFFTFQCALMVCRQHFRVRARSARHSALNCRTILRLVPLSPISQLPGQSFLKEGVVSPHVGHL